MKKLNNLTEGNISKLLLGLAIPIMGSSFLQMAYGLVDMFWIGRIGSSAVAAIGTASFFLNLGEAINSIVVMGGGIKVSHSVGSKNYADSDEYISNSFILNILIAFIYILILILFKDSLIDFFNLNNILVEKEAKIYLIIVGIGLLFKFNNLLYVRILNSFGESKLPFKINSVGVILNIILDPLLIFGLNLGVAGAAIATIFSQAVNTYLFMRASRKYFVIDLKINFNKILTILSMGIPLGIQRILFTGFGIVIGKIISLFGPDAIAAQKIGLQIEAISYMTVGGLYGATASFIGQNFGANKPSRIVSGYKISLLIALSIGIFTTIIFTCFPKFLMEIFVKDEKTISSGIGYLRIVGISQIFMCIEIVTNGSFNGLGQPKIPSIVSVIFTSLRIPLAYYLIKDFGIDGVWISISSTSIIKGIITPTLFYLQLKKFKNYQEEICEKN